MPSLLSDWKQDSRHSCRVRMSSAWACYEPARALAYPDPVSNERRAAAPGVLQRRLEPVCRGDRDRAYRGEEVPSEPLSGARLNAVLRSLPIPVIGLPWYQRQHLPDALVIGHEVGHLVEEDFGLTVVVSGSANAAAEGAGMPGSLRRERFFADVSGCLACGPGFVATLMEHVRGYSGLRDDRDTAGSPWWEYPTTALRSLSRRSGSAPQADRG